MFSILPSVSGAQCASSWSSLIFQRYLAEASAVRLDTENGCIEQRRVQSSVLIGSAATQPTLFRFLYALSQAAALSF